MGTPQWRISELARRAAVSEQQIRNYADAGLLPETGRADNGYRVFTQQHADALDTLRALAAGHGWNRARRVMRALCDHSVEAALSVLDGGHAELDQDRRLIASTRRVFATLTADTAPATRETVRISPLAASVHVTAPVLRTWEDRGLLSPARDSANYRVYDRKEQQVAQLVAVLRRGLYGFDTIGPLVAAVRAGRTPQQLLRVLDQRSEQVTARSVQCARGTAAVVHYINTWL
jgi:DNA-binding transcriptional MerR regulator